MMRRRLYSMGLTLVVFLLLGLAGPAAANDDPLLSKPVVLLIIDTSGSMGWDFGRFKCGGNDQDCNRMDVVQEALTGTYPDSGLYCNEGGATNSQLPDGILDRYKKSVRFGLATFDASYSTWNYGDSSFRYGIKPRVGDGCSGVECLFDFLNPNDPAAIISHNEEIEGRICGLHPSGSTPLGAALYDADWYLNHWQAETGYTDTFFECRPKYVILFTDGAETCCTAKGDLATNAGNLFNNGLRNNVPDVYWPTKTDGVPVFVVGMGDRAHPENFPGIDIAALDAGANAGSGGVFPEAFMADDSESLRAQFDLILSAILAGSSSRTEVSSHSTLAYGSTYQYKAYFDATVAGPWNGHLVREEITDSNGDGVPEYVGPPLLFEDKLAAQNPNDRVIYSIYDDPRSRDHDLFRTMDQFKSGIEASPDGSDESLMCLPENPVLPDVGDDDDDDDDDDSISEANYANYIKDFLRGVDGKKTLDGNWETDGNPWLGDIFHASPVAVGPPSSLAPDYKYEAYFLNNRERPAMVYAGANDGLLHAFIGEVPASGNSSDEGKELWAFLPPRLLASIQQIRSQHRPFVDATPVVRDVYFNDLQEQDQLGNDYPFLGAYRTVLIGGLRGGGNAYYALDVTNPAEPKYLWEYRPGVFTTTDASDNPVYPYTNTSVQCKPDIAESWAKPIVGQIWVKMANEVDKYQARSVAIVPGGFMPGSSYANLSSCMDLIELSIFPTTLHIIDIETGKLLKRYSFTDEGAFDDLEADLEDYYELMDSGNTNPWNKYANCKEFETDDFDEVASTGWACGEKRKNLQHPPYVPEELKSDEMCWECPNDIACAALGEGANISYAKVCCANPTVVPPTGIQECRKINHGPHSGECRDEDGTHYHRCDNGYSCLNCVCTALDSSCTMCSRNQDCPEAAPVCEDAVCKTVAGAAECWGAQQGAGAHDVPGKCGDPSMASLNAARNCSTRYIEYDDGSVDFWLKTEGCFLLDDKPEEGGRLCFHVGGNFALEGVAAHPAAYNTTFGEFITRVFMPTTGGLIWRMDMANGLYDVTADEGAMIEDYTDDGSGADVDYAWKASEFFDMTTVPDPENDPVKIAKRPIMAPPALAMTHSRSLVLFFGTGRTDDLEYYPDRDYFFAVEEAVDADDKPTGFGELFHKDGAAAGTAMKLDDGERLYGKPLVVAGKVVMTTFIADPDLCNEGGGRMHIFNYDETPADTSGVIQTHTMVGEGTPSPPTMVWTPQGPVVLAQMGAGVEVLPVANQIKPTAHALHWGQVL